MRNIGMANDIVALHGIEGLISHHALYFSGNNARDL